MKKKLNSFFGTVPNIFSLAEMASPHLHQTQNKIRTKHSNKRRTEKYSFLSNLSSIVVYDLLLLLKFRIACFDNVSYFYGPRSHHSIDVDAFLTGRVVQRWIKSLLFPYFSIAFPFFSSNEKIKIGKKFLWFFFLLFLAIPLCYLGFLGTVSENGSPLPQKNNTNKRIRREDKKKEREKSSISLALVRDISVYHNLDENPPGGTRCRLGVSSFFSAASAL